MRNNNPVQLDGRKRTLIFVCLIVSGIASSILSTAMTTALPNVVEYFQVSTSVGQWVTSGYSLAMGMIMPLTAYLITRFSYQKAVSDRDRLLYGRFGPEHLRGELRAYDGRKDPAGMRKRRFDVSGAGDHPDCLSH